MRPAVPLLLLLALLVAACSAPPRVRVDRQPGLDGAWQLPVDGGPSLDATGGEVTLRFRGRILVFPMMRCRGVLAEEEVRLEGGGLKIRLTPERAEVVAGETRTATPLADLPPNRRLLFRDGAFHAG